MGRRKNARKSNMIKWGKINGWKRTLFLLGSSSLNKEIPSKPK